MRRLAAFLLLFFCLLPLWSQRAPFTFFYNGTSPNNIGTGLSAWWTADSFSGLTNNTLVGTSNLSVWKDSSGNGHDCVANGAATQPVFSFSTFNGKSSVAVTNSGNLTNNGITLSSDFTVIVVVSNCTSDGYILGNLTANRQCRLNRSGANVVSFFAGNAEVISSTFASANTTRRCITFRRSAGTVSFLENLTPQGSGTEAGSFTVNQVGNSTGAGGGSPRGFFAEIVIYTNFVSDGSITNLYNNYFKPRWGLP